MLYILDSFVRIIRGKTIWMLFLFFISDGVFRSFCKEILFFYNSVSMQEVFSMFSTSIVNQHAVVLLFKKGLDTNGNLCYNNGN